ncbi:hypothetical protein KSS43_000822 [Citrobacter koseri]|nr:hypothetical protein [Citrobacter koseri]EKU8893333.1 hypothetical protein [Citrobacter koseri]
MAGLTKEQRAQRAAEKLAAEMATDDATGVKTLQLVTMVIDIPAFPGAPTTADVHPEEVDNWKAHGWRVEG